MPPRLSSDLRKELGGDCCPALGDRAPEAALKKPAAELKRFEAEPKPGAAELKRFEAELKPGAELLEDAEALALGTTGGDVALVCDDGLGRKAPKLLRVGRRPSRGDRNPDLGEPNPGAADDI